MSIRIGAVSSMAAQAASAFGTAVISQNVASDPRYYYGAGLSPDGTHFVISSPTIGGSTTPHDLLYGSSQGGQLVNLTNSVSQEITNIYPDISPDGTRIIFSRGTNGSSNNRDLYLINIDGTGLTQLTNTPNFNEIFPSWSPDGTAITFTGVHFSGHESDPPALQSGETANGNIYLLQLPAATSAITVTPKTKLTDPPFVEVLSKTATFTFVPFSKAAKKSAALAAFINRAKNSSAKYTFNYKLQYGITNAKKKDLRTKTSKRNVLALKNLKPGNYTASYQVEIFKKEGKNSKLQGRTKFSPTASFTID